MLENWLSPSDSEHFDGEKWEPFQIGKHVRMHSGAALPSLKDVQIAILGIGDRDADAVRQELYRMSFPFDGLNIADLGNVRRKSVSFIIPSIKELFDSKIFPVIIGTDPVFTLAQYKAFQSLQQLVSLVLVDERIAMSPTVQDAKRYYLNELMQHKPSQLFHLGFIGAQTHFTDPATLRFVEQHNYDCIRLGRARTNLAELEPIIRDGDLLSLHLGALKCAEAFAINDATPSGFSVEDACQIARYAGMSDKLKSFGIFGYRHSLDRRQMTAQAAAQIIWYFLDGFHSRKNDYPVSTDGLMEYIVDFKKMEYQLTFWKSQKSGRWWMQVPVKTNKKYQRHRLIPCSYNDYKLACQEELPERLLNAYKRFS